GAGGGGVLLAAVVVRVVAAAVGTGLQRPGLGEIQTRPVHRLGAVAAGGLRLGTGGNAGVAGERISGGSPKVIPRGGVARADRGSLVAGRRLEAAVVVQAHDRALGVVIAFQQGVLGEDLLDLAIEFDGGELQQPDRLLQLRRQRQVLALTHLQRGLHLISPSRGAPCLRGAQVRAESRETGGGPAFPWTTVSRGGGDAAR